MINTDETESIINTDETESFMSFDLFDEIQPFPDEQEDLILNNQVNSILHTESEQQLITMHLQQYKDLIQLIPQVEKYKKTIEKLQNKIKSKDAQLKDLQRSNQSEQKMNNNLSKLSDVSICDILKLSS